MTLTRRRVCLSFENQDALSSCLPLNSCHDHENDNKKINKSVERAETWKTFKIHLQATVCLQVMHFFACLPCLLAAEASEFYNYNIQECLASSFSVESSALFEKGKFNWISLRIQKFEATLSIARLCSLPSKRGQLLPIKSRGCCCATRLDFGESIKFNRKFDFPGSAFA